MCKDRQRFGDFLRSAKLLRPESMTASAWLHRCKDHQILEVTEQVLLLDHGSIFSKLDDTGVEDLYMLDSGDMMQGRRGMLKICVDDRSAFTCSNRDVFLQISAPCRSPN